MCAKTCLYTLPAIFLGSFATASCCRCKHRVDCDAIREDVMKQVNPLWKDCLFQSLHVRTYNLYCFKQILLYLLYGYTCHLCSCVDVLVFVVQQVPMCPKCEQDKVTEGEDEEEEDILSVMKPDIVFFGEGLPDEFHHALEKDKTKVTWLLPVHIPASLVGEYLCDIEACY